MINQKSNHLGSENNINDIPELILMHRDLGMPEALARSMFDPFEYTLGLTNGDVIEFSYSCWDKEDPGFIKLVGLDKANLVKIYHGEKITTCGRGVFVRISDISWCANAPTRD